MKIVGCIMAHAQAQATFDRHLPFWQSHNIPLSVACPGDSKVLTTLPMFTVGRRSHHDAMANLRFRATLEWLLRDVPSDWYVIHEYDSLCLTQVMPELFDQPAILGNVFQNLDPRFYGTLFIHPPLLVDRMTLGRICEVGRSIPLEAEHGFWDRWLGLVCDVGAIPVRGYGAHGFSRNTIEPWHMDEAIAAVRDGAVMIHGIKTADVLSELALATEEALTIV